jgi:hypothetical protein
METQVTQYMKKLNAPQMPKSRSINEEIRQYNEELSLTGKIAEQEIILSED